MAPYIVPLVRLVSLSTVTLFSLIVLGTAAHILSVTQSFLSSFDAFAVAVAVLTLVSLPVLLIFSLIRTNSAFPNYVVVEVSWLTLLWILWMSSAGYTSNSVAILSAECGVDTTFFATGRSTVHCSEFQALEAFSWLNWIILLPYTKAILVLAIIQHNRGNYVWTECVHEVNFFAPRAGGVMQPGTVPQPQMSSPQSMVQQPLQQQIPVQYSAGAPPVQQQTPMDAGYAQPPASTDYAPPGQQQTPMNTGYPPANTGNAQAPANTEFSQALGIKPTELRQALRTANMINSKVMELKPR